VNDTDEPKTQAETSPTPNTAANTAPNAIDDGAAPTPPKVAPRPRETQKENPKATATVTSPPMKKTAARASGASPKRRPAGQGKPQLATEPASDGYQSPGRIWPD
jgi:hypothetical protein